MIAFNSVSVLLIAAAAFFFAFVGAAGHYWREYSYPDVHYWLAGSSLGLHEIPPPLVLNSTQRLIRAAHGTFGDSNSTLTAEWLGDNVEMARKASAVCVFLGTGTGGLALLFFSQVACCNARISRMWCGFGGTLYMWTPFAAGSLLVVGLICYASLFPTLNGRWTWGWSFRLTAIAAFLFLLSWVCARLLVAVGAAAPTIVSRNLDHAAACGGDKPAGAADVEAAEVAPGSVEVDAVDRAVARGSAFEVANGDHAAYLLFPLTVACILLFVGIGTYQWTDIDDGRITLGLKSAKFANGAIVPLSWVPATILVENSSVRRCSSATLALVYCAAVFSCLAWLRAGSLTCRRVRGHSDSATRSTGTGGVAGGAECASGPRQGGPETAGRSPATAAASGNQTVHARDDSIIAALGFASFMFSCLACVIYSEVFPTSGQPRSTSTHGSSWICVLSGGIFAVVAACFSSSRRFDIRSRVMRAWSYKRNSFTLSIAVVLAALLVVVVAGMFKREGWARDNDTGDWFGLTGATINGTRRSLSDLDDAATYLRDVGYATLGICVFGVAVHAMAIAALVMVSFFRVRLTASFPFPLISLFYVCMVTAICAYVMALCVFADNFSPPPPSLGCGSFTLGPGFVIVAVVVCLLIATVCANVFWHTHSHSVFFKIRQCMCVSRIRSIAGSCSVVGCLFAVVALGMARWRVSRSREDTAFGVTRAFMSARRVSLSDFDYMDVDVARASVVAVFSGYAGIVAGLIQVVAAGTLHLAYLAAAEEARPDATDAAVPTGHNTVRETVGTDAAMVVDSGVPATHSFHCVMPPGSWTRKWWERAHRAAVSGGACASLLWFASATLYCVMSPERMEVDRVVLFPELNDAFVFGESVGLMVAAGLVSSIASGLFFRVYLVDAIVGVYRVDDSSNGGCDDFGDGMGNADRGTQLVGIAARASCNGKVDRLQTVVVHT